MATLPIYQRQVSPNGLGYQPRASGQDAIGASLQQAGSMLDSEARRLQVEDERRKREIERKQDEDARAWTSSALSDSHVTWSSRLSELEQQAPEGAPNFAKQVLSEFDEYRAGALKNAPNEKAKQFYGERLDALRSNIVGQAVGFEARKNVEWKVQQGKLATDRVADMATTDPGQAKIMLAEQEAIWGGYSNKQLAEQMVVGAREKASLNAVGGMIARDPAASLDLLDKRVKDKKSGDFWVDMLDGRQLLALRHQAMTEVQRIGAEGRFTVASQTKDVQSMVMNGIEPPPQAVPSREAFAKAYGPNGAAMWDQEVGNYLEIGNSIRTLKTASFEDRQKLVTDARPDAGTGFAGKMQMRDALVQAASIVNKQIASDPAQYAIQNSPRVQNAAAVMSKVLNDPGTSAEDRAAVTDFFVRTTTAEQLRLGVDQIRDEQAGNKIRGPRLLTNQQANAIADRFSSPEEGGVNAANTILALERQYGKHWPKVYGQLASDNKLPPAALVIPNMPNDASRARMAQVSAMKPDDLKALVGASDPQDIRAQIKSEFEDAQKTFVAQGAGGNSTLAVVIEQAEKLATLYRSQGKSVKEAARQAYTETMGHRYQFADTYRVPVGQSLKDVQRGTDEILRGVISGGAKVFDGAAATVLSEDALRHRTMWITNSDESGLQLMVRGADGGVYGVRGKDDRPIVADWATLATGAKAFKARDDSQEGNEEFFRRRQQELNPRR